MLREFYRVMGKMIAENRYKTMSVLEFVLDANSKSDATVPEKLFKTAYYDLLRDKGLTDTLWSNY